MRNDGNKQHETHDSCRHRVVVWRGQPDPDEALKRFILFDADKDGFVSREEFMTGSKPKK